MDDNGSNRSFYDLTLRNGQVVESLPDRPAIEGHIVDGTVETVEHSKANPTEARLVTHLVGELSTTLPPTKSA